MKEKSEVNMGATKRVTDPDNNGYVLKTFKHHYDQLPIHEQERRLELKKKYFGEYIPETILIKENENNYHIKQQYIEGKTLSNIDISQLSYDTLFHLLDLIKKYLLYCKEENQIPDLTGYQYYKNDKNTIIRSLRNFLKINKNFLYSTNIIISSEGKVFMVDVCDGKNYFRGRIKNFCAKPFVKHTISELEKILASKKIDDKSEDLYNILHK